METRKRPSTSFQTEKDGDQRKGTRPRLSSPSSKLQSQLDRLEARVASLSDSVQECAEKSEEVSLRSMTIWLFIDDSNAPFQFDSARGLIEQKLCDDEGSTSTSSVPRILREVRKEVAPQIKTVTDQVSRYLWVCSGK